MTTNNDINSSFKELGEFLDKLKTDVINSLQANGSTSSTKAAAEIKVTSSADKAQLEIPGYMQILETGRKPTSKNPQAGSIPMIQRIQQWCRENGIPDKEAWAIKKAIDKHGFKGKSGLLSVPLGNENVSSRLQPVMNEIADKMVNKILQNLGH